MVDLRELEYPRMLHKGPDVSLRVENADHAARELANGWSLEIDMDDKAGPAITDGQVVPATVDVGETLAVADEDDVSIDIDPPLTVPAKRGPGRPKKQEREDRW